LNPKQLFFFGGGVSQRTLRSVFSNIFSIFVGKNAVYLTNIIIIFSAQIAAIAIFQKLPFFSESVQGNKIFTHKSTCIMQNIFLFPEKNVFDLYYTKLIQLIHVV
jgi:hypothetical protein